MRFRFAGIVSLGVLIVSAAAFGTSPALKPFERGTAKRPQGHAGRPVLVHFWGVTCGPCKVELPLLGQFAKEHPEIDVVTVSADLVPNLPAATQSMLDKAGLSSTENFIFNDGFVERLRFEIDPARQGDIPAPCSSRGKGPSRRSKALPKSLTLKNGRRNNSPNTEVQVCKGNTEMKTISKNVLLAAFALAISAGPALAEDVKAGDLVISQPWSRATPGGAKVAGGYLVIENKGTAPDRLIGGSADIAGKFEIHEMAVENGVMKMRALDKGLTIEPGKTVKFAPGGYHLMPRAQGPVQAGRQGAGDTAIREGRQSRRLLDVRGVGACAPATPGIPVTWI